MNSGYTVTKVHLFVQGQIVTLTAKDVPADTLWKITKVNQTTIDVVSQFGDSGRIKKQAAKLVEDQRAAAKVFAPVEKHTLGTVLELTEHVAKIKQPVGTRFVVVDNKTEGIYTLVKLNGFNDTGANMRYKIQAKSLKKVTV
jgi:hypothetical protein